MITPLRVLAGRLNLSQLSAIMEKRSKSSHSEDTYPVNKIQIFVTEPRSEPATPRKNPFTPKVLQRPWPKSTGWGYPGYEEYGDRRHRWMPTWELWLITEVDQSEAYARSAACDKAIEHCRVIALLAANFGWSAPIRSSSLCGVLWMPQRQSALTGSKLSWTLTAAARWPISPRPSIAWSNAYPAPWCLGMPCWPKSRNVKKPNRCANGPGRFEALQQRTPAICLRGVPRLQAPAHGSSYISCWQPL